MRASWHANTAVTGWKTGTNTGVTSLGFMRAWGNGDPYNPSFWIINDFVYDSQIGYSKRNTYETRPKSKFYNLLIYAGYPNK